MYLSLRFSLCDSPTGGKKNPEILENKARQRAYVGLEGHDRGKA